MKNILNKIINTGMIVIQLIFSRKLIQNLWRNKKTHKICSILVLINLIIYNSNKISNHNIR